MQGYLLFTGAFLVSVATPGPDVAIVVGRGLADSSVARCLSLIAGIISGKLLFLVAALLGISALAASLGPLFMAVKLAGAAYLAYLGITFWRRSPRDGFEAANTEAAPATEVGLGLAMSLGNPLAILFYAALLPNVVDVESVSLGMAFILMAIVGGCTFAVYGAYAAGATRVGALIRSEAAQRRVNRAAGAAIVGAAAFIALR